MKVIFLDIDGVLVTNLSEQCEEGPFWHKFDQTSVERLNRIIQATDAEIVLSSTWRIGRDFGQLGDYFISQGVCKKPIEKTPRFGGQHRGDEIADYLGSHSGIESFVIIDDDSDMDDLLPYLVQTDFEYGIQEEHIQRAIELLRSNT